jgi:ssDNA-binding Zn-finger/Zn-ribbon topoisomerase 1
MNDLHINWTRYSETFCSVNDCPTCRKPRRMLAQVQEWYGTTWTCAGCGEMWSDGERHERPFCPGWRKENIERARKALAGMGVQA